MKNYPFLTAFLFLSYAVFVLSCQEKSHKTTEGKDPSQPVAFSSQSHLFGMIDTSRVYQYTLSNPSGMVVKILNYGGIVTGIQVPDRTGKSGDVVLGFDSLTGYLNKDNPYIGALIGRFANRINQAKFVLDGKLYTVGANDHGNSLHGGWKGFDKVIWKSITMTSDSGASLALSYDSKDGEEGYPGNLHAAVTYTLTRDNSLRIDYTATSDKPTPINMTNHSYFNLAGGMAPDVLDHEIMLNADSFTQVDNHLIPTGRQIAVSNGPMDYKKSKKIGEDIHSVQGGYDHNFCLNHPGGELALAARVYEPRTGRVMEMYTTEPGLQFYTGNFLNGQLTGKNREVYVPHYGFCLEAQHYPDSPNEPSFPNSILHPGETYHQVTLYKFSTK